MPLIRIVLWERGRPARFAERPRWSRSQDAPKCKCCRVLPNVLLTEHQFAAGGTGRSVRPTDRKETEVSAHECFAPTGSPVASVRPGWPRGGARVGLIAPRSC